jgi:hypothetical protein
VNEVGLALLTQALPAASEVRASAVGATAFRANLERLVEEVVGVIG